MKAPETYIPRHPSDFIGPARNIARLLVKKAERLKREHGNARLLLYGPPGVGKTRLAELLASRLTGLPEVVHGRNVNADIVRRWIESSRYVPLPGYFSTVIINETDTVPPVAQDILLEYLDIAASTPGMVVIGTSNLDLSHLVERFQSRFQQLKVDPPDTEAVVEFILRWRIGKKVADMIAVGSGGNVRAALLDAQGYLDAV